MSNFDSTALHIIPGASAAGSFKQAFGSNAEILIHQDMLSFGPTPPIRDVGEWMRIRDDFLGDDRRRWQSDFLSSAARMRGRQRIHVWAGSGIEDQLFVALVIALADVLNLNSTSISIIQFATTGSRRVVGLGELGPEQLRNGPVPNLLTGGTRIEYREAWGALTASDPDFLDTFEQRHPNLSPFIRDAMRLMLRRYPERRSGLGYWDFVLLQSARDRGPRAARAIAHALTHEEPRGLDWVGDFYLFDRMYWMSDDGKLSKPLLDLSRRDAPMFETEVRITKFGQAVLAGEESYFPTNPIDHWVGGVHLSSTAGTLWFNDNGRIVRG